MINKRMVNTRLDCQSKLKENNKLIEIKTSRIKVLHVIKEMSDEFVVLIAIETGGAIAQYCIWDETL